jgi:hypothetical protein
LLLVKAIAPALFALATLSCAAGEQPAAHKLDYRRRAAGDYTMVLDGAEYTTRDTFTAAIAKLPPRSRLTWNSGCTAFDDIPLGAAPE